MIFKNQSVFWLLTIGVFIWLVFPLLFQDGMFMDGLQYAIVAKHLSDGLGTFWCPHSMDTWLVAGSNCFLEQPPLVYWIQSWFFEFLGNGIYTERLYSLVTALVTAWIIHQIWKIVQPPKSENHIQSWWPVLLWIVVPVCHWSYQNDIQECTMGIFTTSAIWLYLKAVQAKKNSWLFLLGVGVSIFLATLSKGVPGFFPLAAPVLYWLCTRKVSIGQSILHSMVLLAIIVVIYGITVLDEEAKNSLSFYINERLLERVESAPTVDSRWAVLRMLVEEMLVAIAVIAVVVVSAISIGSNHVKFVNNGAALFLTSMGLAASIPLTLTTVQRAFYFLPAIPMLALGIALFTVPFLSSLIRLRLDRPKWQKVFFALALVAIISGLAYTIVKAGKPGRDYAELNDSYIIGPNLPLKTTVSLQSGLTGAWSLRYYLLRHYGTSSTGESGHQYKIVKKGVLEDGYGLVSDLATEKYDLLKQAQ